MDNQCCSAGFCGGRAEAVGGAALECSAGAADDAIATKNVCQPVQNDGKLTIRGNSGGWTAEPIASGGDLTKCGDKATETFKLRFRRVRNPAFIHLQRRSRAPGFRGERR